VGHRGLAGQAALAVLAAMLVGTVAAAHAKDCAGATPLPADVTITPPAADVSADLARFSGAWAGAWAPRGGGEGPCGVLVVEDVFANGYARVVYSVGVSDPLLPQPRAWRASGRVVDGVLRFELPLSWRPELTYRFAGNDLAGTFKDFAADSTTTAARIADLRRVACPRLPPVAAPSSASRDRIVAAELLSPNSPGGLVHNDYFMPIGTIAPARHALRGALTIHAAKISRAHDGCAGLDVPAAGFTAAFFTQGEHLVPAVRTIIRPPGSKAGVILSPGRVWSEPGDRGMSRASFPYVVVDEIGNGTRNGLASFLFDDARVSNLRVQISQETMEWSRDDFWGQAPMTYAPGPIADEARLRAEFDAERRLETPMKPWSALPASKPSRWLDAFDGDAARDDISANGLVIDGVLYVKACHTRTGPYPYCRHIRHGVFSVTKTLGAVVALLRLAQKYGDGVFDLKIADYVRVTATHDGWRDVTFADALSMSAPIGDLGPRRDWPQPDPDENKPKFYEWIEARTAQQKLDRGFTYGRYPWARGEVVRYNSVVTFTLAAAMDSYLKQKAGPSAHLWDMVVDEVYRPIGIFHEPTMHTLEADGSRGIPLLGYGLTPTIDDVAKLTTLWQQGGRHDGVQLLSAAKLAEALYRTSATGLSVLRRSRYGDYRYQLSFWSVPYVTELGCRFLIPHMSGYGGNFVVLLPNGISTFRFADGNTGDIETMILAGEAIRPFCTSAPAAAPPQAPAAPLGAAELRAELPGNTFGAGLTRVFIAPDGRQYVMSGTAVDVGRWRITPEGLYCRAWNVADGGRERCYRVYRDVEKFSFNVHDRWTVLRWTRTPGRAAGF
jgi:Beta-lactamase